MRRFHRRIAGILAIAALAIAALAIAALATVTAAAAVSAHGGPGQSSPRHSGRRQGSPRQSTPRHTSARHTSARQSSAPHGGSTPPARPPTNASMNPVPSPASALSTALMPFRVDVSRRPEIGMVITVPQASRPLTGKDITVQVGGASQHPSVRQLSPGDLQIVFSPDLHVRSSELGLERSAGAGFLAGLPAGAEAAVSATGQLTGDPAAAVTSDLALARGPREPAALRLTEALSAFSPGASVRRTVVLVLSANEPLGAAASARLRRQLAASGTSLYLLDASPTGAPAYTALVAGNGGFVTRIRTAGDWPGALRRIGADLNRQYYVRFTDTAPLPAQARINVRTPAGTATAVATLPAANPTAPPLAPVASASRAAAVVRREPRGRRRRAPMASASPPAAAHELFFVFLLPCLNEEKVILNSLRRLLSLPGENFGVMVIDDGSDDGTAAAVRGVADERVRLMQRTPPNARQGKGEALNAAIARLSESSWLEGRDPDRIVVVVVDADGRVDPHSLSAVAPYFADPTVGAVQIGVRINNREMSRLARMQDMEFVIYTEVFQRGRRHLGSVGLGGNGQFMRLSALRSLGEAPWTRSLTEDLDLGIRLLTAGWRNEYCHTAAVHQQGVIELRRLIRQRSRWFQGHLQSWKLIPRILRGAPRPARVDLLYHLSSPALLLIGSLLTASFACSLLGSGVVAADGGNPLGWWVLSTYALAFGPAVLYSYTYWLRERDRGMSLARTAGLAHLYVGYCLMWYAAGWWAVGRTLRRRTNWSKTDRVAEAPLVALERGPDSSQARFAQNGDRRLAVIPAPAPSPSGAPRPPGRRRAPLQKSVRTVSVAAAVGFAALGVALLSFGGHSRPVRSDWYQVFSGYGHTSLTGSGPSQAITLSVATTQSPRVTHAALVLSRTWYQDFVAGAQVRTTRQLRHGAAGTPNPWEVGWVVWHYSSPQRFYALTLEPTGWLLSKQDPAYPGGERFLASGKLPQFPIGAEHRVGVVQSGNQITVSAEGRVLTKFVDTERPYLTGGFGVYAEDSVARFDDIHVQALPAGSAAAANPKP